MAISDEDLEPSEGEQGFILDDSDEDPTFDILEEETRSGFRKLSIKKPKSSEANLPESEEEPEEMEVAIPKLDDKDQKCFEKVDKMIKDGQLEKLRVDECKIYLRKYGLRLTGKKEILLARIREHLEILDGGGEKKYPRNSFIINCKGDACMGDIVMFKQNVYEMYNVASRSASAPPCGTRVIAGRIVKESYGSAKQQHTFTIEVLWSKGDKPLPPLHPLLIKGRNLYRLKTMRQKWDDEDKRRQVLQEKHQRGNAARFYRENRIQQMDERKLARATWTENRNIATHSQQKSQHHDVDGHLKDAYRRSGDIQKQVSSSTNVLMEQQNQHWKHTVSTARARDLKDSCNQSVNLTRENFQIGNKPHHREFRDTEKVQSILQHPHNVKPINTMRQTKYHEPLKQCDEVCQGESRMSHASKHENFRWHVSNRQQVSSQGHHGTSSKPSMHHYNNCNT